MVPTCENLLIISMHKLSNDIFKQVGFTLTELMISVGVFTIGIAVAYPLMVSDMNLYIRNFSINKSNNSLRYALQSLRNDIDMACESPRLMSYTSNNDGTGNLTPVASSGTEDLTVSSSDAMMMWVNRGAMYNLMPIGANTTVNPSTGITIKGAVTSPAPEIGDRLIIQSPSPYPTNPNMVDMSDKVMMNNVSFSKPGRSIIGVVGKHNVGDPFSLYTIQLNLTNPLPTSIPSNNTVYIAREVAYIAYTINDKSGKVVRQLLYCSNTNPTNTTTNPSNAITCKLLTSDLDPSPLLGDRLLTTSTMAFNYKFNDSVNTTAQLTPNPQSAGLILAKPYDNPPLMINLPIRALDYAQLSGMSYNNNISTGFNVFVRGNPVMCLKNP